MVYLSPNLCDFYETFMIHCHLYEGWKYKKLITLLIIFIIIKLLLLNVQIGQIVNFNK